ncbi:hypothetical protein H312_03364 [Anncaliia algerae PRA339]|uniref:ISXO2-like transposase domain-containing protein n=1 Tax=Anncaliia algerae PRA339 TaxID=1288291 RepID=A0A059EWE6_9MICR|nr:hypothetical protein H312_03364 [Anncaliia algerae PRA339]
MMNYKAKSHRGRSPNNRTDALCIIECLDGINRAYASIIPEKKVSRILPIILRQLAENSVIWTDEHKSYIKLLE